MTELEKLLSRLPSVEKASQFLTYEGKAVSRDKSHLHLATTSGVIAIPLADIKEVKALSGQSSDIVSVSVTSTDRIKHIRHLGPMFRGGGGGGGWGGWEDPSATKSYTDSATVTGGVADATDDAFWVTDDVNM
jgi:hypothetical protein